MGESSAHRAQSDPPGAREARAPLARVRELVNPPVPDMNYFSFPDLRVRGDATADWLLQAKGVTAGYGSVPAIRDIDLEVRAGEVVTLLGPNGAGKTTTLLTLSGVLPPMSGAIWWNGALTNTPPHRRVREGLGFVTEERAPFTQMRTADNLRVARGDLALALELFPELQRLLDQSAGLLSGGEQQMLSLARALCRRPKLLLVDELSLGLAPLVVSRLIRAVRRAADELNTGVVLVEQHITKALQVSDRGYVMQRGRIVLRGRADELREQAAEIQASYLATPSADARSSVAGTRG